MFGVNGTSSDPEVAWFFDPNFCQSVWSPPFTVGFLDQYDQVKDHSCANFQVTSMKFPLSFVSSHPRACVLSSSSLFSSSTSSMGWFFSKWNKSTSAVGHRVTKSLSCFYHYYSWVNWVDNYDQLVCSGDTLKQGSIIRESLEWTHYTEISIGVQGRNRLRGNPVQSAPRRFCFSKCNQKAVIFLMTYGSDSHLLSVELFHPSTGIHLPKVII